MQQCNYVGISAHIQVTFGLCISIYRTLAEVKVVSSGSAGIHIIVVLVEHQKVHLERRQVFFILYLIVCNY